MSNVYTLYVYISPTCSYVSVISFSGKIDMYNVRWHSLLEQIELCLPTPGPIMSMTRACT